MSYQINEKYEKGMVTNNNDDLKKLYKLMLKNLKKKVRKKRRKEKREKSFKAAHTTYQLSKSYI